MKTPVNFRLEDSTLSLLKQLTAARHTTQTAIIEAAVRLYARQQNLRAHPLSRYAGILAAEEADAMLTDIRESRQDKAWEFKL